MDKNQIIGLALIFAMVVGFNFFTADQKPVDTKTSIENTALSGKTKVENTIVDNTTSTHNIDSGKTITPERIITVENKDIKFKISSKGAKIYDIELANYLIHDKTKQVVLLQKDKTNAKTFVGGENINDESINYSISTGSSSVKITDTPQTITLSAVIANGKTITQSFTLAPKGFIIDKKIAGSALANQVDISFEFNNTLPVTERKFDNPEAYKFARQHSTANYLTSEDEFDDIGLGTDDDENIEESVKWFSFRQRFFTIGEAPEANIKNLRLTSSYNESSEDLDYIRKMYASYSVPLNTQKEYNSRFYAGPNDFHILEETGITDFGKNVDMGWLIFGVINKYVILPVFSWLASTIGNFGLVIMLLVLFIKIVLFPIAYKSYSSMAKMKALKPDLDELKKKHGDDQQAYGAAQMGLYRQAGVNPLSGCLPQVLQIPILFALFRFFPNAIQLRQESFLWALDLSTYDALISWDTWVWGVGTHISIFTILMTLTTLVNSWYNSQFSATNSNNPAADQMKYLMYFMPLIFFFVLNDYPSGLTFYYFISTLFTIGQQFVANKMIDTDKIRMKIDTNVKNSNNGTNPAKKSRFQQRLETAMEAQKAAKKGKK